MTGIALDKAHHAAALQCARRLWLRVHAPGRAAPPEPALEQRLEVGRRIGARARLLFPGGVRVEGPFEAALLRTRTLLREAAVPALFEAAFEHDGVRVRADVVERLSGGRFGLREVKSAAGVRDEHLDDVVLQLFALRGSAVDVASVEIVHVDPDYVRGASGLDWRRLFRRVDVTRDAEFLLADVPQRVAQARATLGEPEEPEVEPSPHCRRPALCEFWAHCADGRPADWIYRVPGIREAEFQALLERGVRRIADIPDDFPLRPRQARAREAHRRGGEAASPALGELLAETGPPACYLDFETYIPAVPAYTGTRPYQRIPCQWSLHLLDAAGRLSHAEFLAGTDADPRRAFADALLAALADDAIPILVYSGYEGEVIAELERDLPDLASGLARIRARLVDLLEILRSGLYATAFHGSFSLKRVVAALVPEFSYADLRDVADGAGAALALARLVEDRPAPAERARLRSALRAYCQRDTAALVVLHRALRERARGPAPAASSRDGLPGR